MKYVHLNSFSMNSSFRTKGLRIEISCMCERTNNGASYNNRSNQKIPDTNYCLLSTYLYLNYCVHQIGQKEIFLLLKYLCWTVNIEYITNISRRTETHNSSTKPLSILKWLFEFYKCLKCCSSCWKRLVNLSL